MSARSIACFDGGALERREREDRSPAHGRFVGGGRDDRRDATFVADRPERGDRRLTHERIRRTAGEFDQSHHDLVASRFVFAA